MPAAKQTRKLNIVDTSNDTTHDIEKETEVNAESNHEENEEIVLLTNAVRESKKLVNEAQQKMLKAFRGKNAQERNEAIETFDIRQQELAILKKELHEMKISGNRNGKPMCAWCGKKPAKDGGFCSMKHAATYGEVQYKDFAYGSPDKFSDAMYKLVTGEEKQK